MSFEARSVDLRAGSRLRAGLTLVEIGIALAIVAALAALAIPRFTSYGERVARVEAIAQIRQVEMAVDRYRSEFGRLPLELEHAVSPVPIDPWGSPLAYLNLQTGDPSLNGLRRKDKNLVPINSDYDLYSRGPDGASKPPLTAAESLDDIVRANDGAFIGPARDY